MSCIILGILVLTVELDTLKMIKTAKLAVIPMVLALPIWAVEDVIIKYSLNVVTILFTYFWLRISGFITLTTLSYFTNAREQIHSLSKFEFEGYSIRLALFAALTSSAGLVLAIVTYSLVPLSIASPLVGSYPIFTIFLLYIAQRLGYFTEREKEPLPKRILSVTLFMVGIIIISITV